MTCYWEVKVEAFTGVRLEIGVATRRSIYRGGYNKDEVRPRMLYMCFALDIFFVSAICDSCYSAYAFLLQVYRCLRRICAGQGSGIR